MGIGEERQVASLFDSTLGKSTLAPMSTDGFYAGLPALTDFADVLRAPNYRELPPDWVLFIADVRNSTDAIRRGLYRAVNMVGAACITAALNGCPGVALPFIFGGDGATLAAPKSVAATVARELQGVAAMAKAQFEMELRIGRVTVRELQERGHTVAVAKYRLAGSDELAMLRGSGVAEAERWIKSPHSTHLLPADGVPPQAGVTGLSCRWQPLRSVHGEMLTLLVHALGTDADADRYYRDFYSRLRALLGLRDEEMNPIKHSNLQTRWPPGAFGVEARAHAGAGGPWRRFVAAAATLAHSFAGATAFRLGWRLPFFNPRRYKDSMIARSDFQKFDGMLRMVIDTPTQKIPAVLAMLDADRARGAICYGVHRSGSALMTCVVFSLQRDSHVHFVDGNDGGYALAAAQIKEQLHAAS